MANRFRFLNELYEVDQLVPTQPPAAAPSPSLRHPAAFLDRDGTIHTDVHFLKDPDALELLPGAAGAISRLRAAGYRIVCVTNQSGIARGLLTEETLERIHAGLQTMLVAKGAQVDAFYHCPHLPDAPVARYAGPCECRKPAPGLFLRAAAELDLDLARSFAVGDRERDVVAGLQAGCPRAFLLADPAAVEQTAATAVVPSLAALVDGPWLAE